VKKNIEKNQEEKGKKIENTFDVWQEPF